MVSGNFNRLVLFLLPDEVDGVALFKYTNWWNQQPQLPPNSSSILLKLFQECY